MRDTFHLYYKELLSMRKLSESENVSVERAGAEIGDHAETGMGSRSVTRRDAMAVMAKYSAATAPVMMTLFHGTDALAHRRRQYTPSLKGSGHATY